jgi:hypothetical protein
VGALARGENTLAGAGAQNARTGVFWGVAGCEKRKAPTGCPAEPFVARETMMNSMAIAGWRRRHLAPSFVADAIRAGAPRFGGKAAARVVPMHRPPR